MEKIKVFATVLIVGGLLFVNSYFVVDGRLSSNLQLSDLTAMAGTDDESSDFYEWFKSIQPNLLSELSTEVENSQVTEGSACYMPTEPAMTTGDGTFSLDVPANSSLSFSIGTGGFEITNTNSDGMKISGSFNLETQTTGGGDQIGFTDDCETLYVVTTTCTKTTCEQVLHDYLSTH